MDGGPELSSSSGRKSLFQPGIPESLTGCQTGKMLLDVPACVLTFLVYNLTYFLDQKMKCLVTQKFDLDPINIDLRNGKMSKILNLEWWASQFLGLKILTLIPLNQYIFNVFLTKFGVLLCLNGGSNGPEINFPGHVMGGLRAGGL